MAIVVTMTKSHFKEAYARFKEGVAMDFAQALAIRAPVDTGFLKNTIGWRVKGNTIEIYMPLYGLFVDQGTAPHLIKPKNGKALVFQVATMGPRGGTGKKTVFAAVVHHPGTKPQPFIRETFRFDLPRIVRENAQRHLI